MQTLLKFTLSCALACSNGVIALHRTEQAGALQVVSPISSFLQKVFVKPGQQVAPKEDDKTWWKYMSGLRTVQVGGGVAALLTTTSAYAALPEGYNAYQALATGGKFMENAATVGGAMMTAASGTYAMQLTRAALTLGGRIGMKTWGGAAVALALWQGGCWAYNAYYKAKPGECKNADAKKGHLTSIAIYEAFVPYIMKDTPTQDNPAGELQDAGLAGFAQWTAIRTKQVADEKNPPVEELQPLVNQQKALVKDTLTALIATEGVPTPTAEEMAALEEWCVTILGIQKASANAVRTPAKWIVDCQSVADDKDVEARIEAAFQGWGAQLNRVSAGATATGKTGKTTKTTKGADSGASPKHQGLACAVAFAATLATAALW